MSTEKDPDFVSSTRKIEGRATSLMGSYEFIEGPEVPPQGNPWKTATLIIDGKGYTEEEHEAEFQRRAKAMLEAGNEMRRIIATCMNIGIDTMYATQAWDEATIKLL